MWGGGRAGSSKKSCDKQIKNLKKANLQSHKNPNPGGRESVVHIFLFLVQFFTWSQKSRRELLDKIFAVSKVGSFFFLLAFIYFSLHAYTASKHCSPTEKVVSHQDHLLVCMYWFRAEYVHVI